ncbi:MAG TPA: hypothetical protein VHB99_07450, partial [Pirellulales bacterium]|nr:hypothetical protein [Pirellulales bacterium]
MKTQRRADRVSRRLDHPGRRGGINDVWHSIYNKGTPKDVYAAGLRRLIAKIEEAGARVLLCTPSVIGEKTDGVHLNAAGNRFVAEQMFVALANARQNAQRNWLASIQLLISAFLMNSIPKSSPARGLANSRLGKPGAANPLEASARPPLPVIASKPPGRYGRFAGRSKSCAKSCDGWRRGTARGLPNRRLGRPVGCGVKGTNCD